MKLFLTITSLTIFLTLLTSWVKAADLTPATTCDPAKIASGVDRCVDSTPPTGYSYSCQPTDPKLLPGVYQCQRDVIGQVQAPAPIKALGIGSAGISKFLNNVIALIYTLASVVFVFMILWGALEWLSSGGNKDNIDNARKRITQAIIGIILFAIAFAILNLVGIFTGFNFAVTKNSPGCSQPEKFHPETTGCIHTIYRNNVPNFEGRCVAVYEKVDASFCSP